MPIFSSITGFKDQKTYATLLKKALTGVKPDSKKKFLYYNQYPFGAKKAPLILVDYNGDCQKQLEKSGIKPTAEGTLSLTSKDELNFEPTKGSLKRSSVKKYLATMGTGLKDVYVPVGETEDDIQDKGGSATQTTQATQTAQTQTTAQSTSGKDAGKKGEFENELRRREVESRIEQLRAKDFPPKYDDLKDVALGKAAALAASNNFKDATTLLDQLAAKAADADSDNSKQDAASGSSGPAPSASGLKWDQWFMDEPQWPASLTKSAWNKNKGAFAKLTLSTGIGDQLKTCQAAFQAAVGKMPNIHSETQGDFAKTAKECQAFMSSGEVKTLQNSLKTLSGLATKAEAECRKNKLISKASIQTCTEMASLADDLLKATNMNKCLATAMKSEQAALQMDKQFVDPIKAEKNVEKRIALCEKFIKENGDLWRQREKIEDILADAQKEWGQGHAQAAYTAQVKGETHDGDAKTPAYNPANKFQPKNLMESKKILNDAKVKELMKNTGLTEGEVIAIRTYTAENYKYINPAIANQKDRTDKESDWMDHKYRPQDPATARNPKRKAELEAKMKKYEEGKDAGSKSSLYEEGSVHAGMIAEALKKLPKKTGTLYRGARMTPADFAKAYAPGQVITCEAFVSQSTSKDTARDFASGKTGQPKDDATVSVFSIAKITDARDIMALSVVGDAEQELLLLPGAKLVVEKIEDDTDQQPGNPTATDWKIVHLKQIE